MWNGTVFSFHIIWRNLFCSVHLLKPCLDVDFSLFCCFLFPIRTMDLFLTSTSAHGLARLDQQQTGFRRCFWLIICLLAYSTTIWLLLSALHLYKDPHNLKTMTMVDTETPLINSTNDWVFPRIYPRYMLCAPDPNVNLAEYKQIHICYHLRTNVTVVENLPEFVPTVVEPLTFGLSWVPFNGMAMCCKLSMETPMIDIKWGKFQSHAHVAVLHSSVGTVHQT